MRPRPASCIHPRLNDGEFIVRSSKTPWVSEGKILIIAERVRVATPPDRGTAIQVT